MSVRSSDKFFQLIGCKSEFYCSFVSFCLGWFLLRQFYLIERGGVHLSVYSYMRWFNNVRSMKICRKSSLMLNKWPWSSEFWRASGVKCPKFSRSLHLKQQTFLTSFNKGSLHTILSILYPQSCIFHSFKTIHKYGIIQSFIFNTISKTKKVFPSSFFSFQYITIRNRFNQIPIKLNLLNVSI